MRIVIADDDALLREGLALLLTGRGFEVAAAVPDAKSFMGVLACEPDVAIVDARLPPTHTDEGIRAAVEARRLHPGLAVLLLSADVQAAFVDDLVASGGGGVGYLLKERVGHVEVFVDALKTVAGGGKAIGPEVISQLVTRRSDPLEGFTVREREVLSLMAEGLGNKAIADRLVVTGGAVHKHIRSIFAKLRLTRSSRLDPRVAAVLHYQQKARPSA
ncbi:response regulator transcription factor [Nonomuraea longicatena]|uniref:Response regulator transcription factor n=1 Tax=Nonomuraea longicatena TaxID=83682 RepID=A0ABP3ZRE8_9ACTN